MIIRKLKAEEIDVRVGSCKENGMSLLLYKDARCDMNILDESVGQMRWKREHTRDNANCIVSIFDEKLGMWVSKEDTGTESNTEKEKGLASDSFKRACFNWGIGRELYTAPFIWISNTNLIKGTGRKDNYGKEIFTAKTTFKCKSISYDENGIINSLEIIDSKTNKVEFSMENLPKIENKPETNVKTEKKEDKKQVSNSTEEEKKKMAIKIIMKIASDKKLNYDEETLSLMSIEELKDIHKAVQEVKVES